MSIGGFSGGMPSCSTPRVSLNLLQSAKSRYLDRFRFEAQAKVSRPAIDTENMFDDCDRGLEAHVGGDDKFEYRY